MSVRLKLNSSSSSGSIRIQHQITNCSNDANFQAGFPSHQLAYNNYTNKNYISGYLKKKNDLGPDKTPFIQRKWTDWYVELNGSSLMFWSVKNLEDYEKGKLDTIKKKAPNFINIADCNVYTCPPLEGSQFNFILNSAGANRFYFQAQSQDILNKWVLALRLSCHENSLIQDYYTSLILNSEAFTSLLHGHENNLFEGFVEIRSSGTLEWCRFWMIINKNKSITFSASKYSKDYFFSLSNIQQAYAIYPDKLELVDQSYVLRVNGEVHAHKDKSLDDTCPPFILIMTNSQYELAQVLISIYDSFKLHNRPKEYNISPIADTNSLYFELNEINTLSAIDVPFIDTRQSLLEFTEQKFGSQSLNPEKEAVIVQEVTEEPEENEFETQTTFQSISSRVVSDNISPLQSALSLKNKPKPRKTFSVSWKEDDNGSSEEEKVVDNKKVNIKPVDSDDDEEDFPKINKSKPITSSKRASINARKQQIDSDESSDEDNNNNNNKPQLLPNLPSLFVEDEELTNSIRQISLYDSLPKQQQPINNLNKPVSEFNSTSSRSLKPEGQLRPISMNKSNSSSESIKKITNKKNNQKNKADLPADSDNSSDDDFPINKLNNKQQQHNVYNQEEEDDDAPIGNTHSIQVDPYNTPYNPAMMRASAYGGIPPVEYGPDGTPYYQNDFINQQQHYDNSNMMYNPSFTQFNPNLQRASNMMDPQEYMRYNEQMASQQRFGPLIQIPNKKQTKPSGGLVGAISAMEKQKAANKYSNSNARRSQMQFNNNYNINADKNDSFDRYKERHLMEQRLMATQSQLFTPEMGYPNQQQPYFPPQQQHRTPYNNINASLSAGSFLHPNNNMHSLYSPSQGILPHMENNGNDLRSSVYRTMDDSMIYNNNINYHPQQPYPNDLYSSQINNNISNAHLMKNNSYLNPNSGENTPPKHHGSEGNSEDEDEDDKPVGTLAKPSANPMFSKGRYREHTVNQLKSRKEESEDESEEEPEIDDDIQETFEEFVDGRLQMKPYGYEPPEKVYQAFLDWCQDEDWDLDDLPDTKTFTYMMIQSGFVKKKKPSNITSDINSKEEEWWYNIAVVNN